MSSPPSGDAAVQALARRLVDAQGAFAEPLPGGDGLRALAWALKDLCLVAFNTEPMRAVSAAAALRRVREGCGARDDSARNALDQEVSALADWAEGIAQITQGHMAVALNHFGSAQAGLRGLGLVGPASQTQVPRMIALTLLGLHDEAAACGSAVQQEFLAQGDRQAAGKVSLNLGNLCMQRDSYMDAVQHYRKAAVLFARVRDHQHSVMADIGLANALTNLGDFGEALRIYARARMRSNEHGQAVMTALIDESMALLDLARGSYRQALAGLEASRKGYEHLGMPQHLATAEKQLADAYLDLHLLPEALSLFDEAQSQFQRLDMPCERAWTLTQIGRTRALMGDTNAAIQALSEAGHLFAEQHNPVGEAAVQLARAESLLSPSSGPADWASAAELARQSAARFSTAQRPDGQTRAETTEAEALLRLGQGDEAEARFNPTLARAQALSLVNEQVRCLSGRGGVALLRGDEPAARSAFEAAIELFEDQRQALPGDELRRAFLGEQLAPYQALLRLALQEHARSPDAAQAQAVLSALERMRARSLREHIGMGPELTDEGADANTPALQTRLNWLYQRTLRLDLDDEPSAVLCDERRELEYRLLETARRQRLLQARHESASPTPRVDDGKDSAALPRLLSAGQALVAYGALDDELFACVVTAEGVTLQRHMARWSSVLEALKALRFQMETLRHGDHLLKQHLPVLARRAQARLAQLHDLVWAPLQAGLAGARRVLVVPHGPLATLPFAALMDNGQVLGEHTTVALAASAHLAHRGLARPPVAPQRVLALGESTRLPHADSEAREVAELYDAGPARVGAEASLAMLQAEAGAADVIHLACHGQFRGDNPMFSALHLADAPLTVEATQRLQLRAATVVLSACDTGLAELGQGDEMFGLVRAFLLAGAARVVASLWPVDDAVTATFMRVFHAGLRTGLPPSMALQAAQNQVRAQHPHPFHWAAFVLHGGW